MRLITLVAALLPLAFAQDTTTTTTITSYTTLTKTITLTPSTTPGGYNATSSYMPTGGMTTTKPIATQGVSGGESLHAAQYALAGVAGMIVVALL